MGYRVTTVGSVGLVFDQQEWPVSKFLVTQAMTSRPSRGKPLGLWWVLLGLVIASCSSSSGDADGATSAMDDVEAQTASDIEITLFDAGEQAFVKNAVFELTARCMAEQGFEWGVPTTQEEFHLGPFPSPDQLREFGYGIDPSEWKELSSDDFEAATVMPEDQRDRWIDALSGSDQASISVRLPNGFDVVTSTDGCYSRSQIAVFGDLPKTLIYDHMVHDLTGGIALTKVFEDPAYEKARQSWRKCVEATGITPLVWANSLREEAVRNYIELDEPLAMQAEKELAETDAQCLTESGFHEARVGLLDTARAEVAAEADYDLAAASLFQQQAVSRANELLAE